VLQMALARGFNGVGLAVVVPAIYSLVADYSDDGTRGAAFGWVTMAQSMGHVAGNSLGVLLAATSFLGVPGWRLAFYALALVSASIAALTWLLGADPRPVSVKATAAATLAQLVREAKDVVKVPTFQIIVAQGVAGSVPWSALSFAAMWLELVGFTHWQTTVITSLNSLANALGSLFAGFVGDPVALRFPNTGRIALAQVCTASSIPLAAVMLLALPDNPSAGAAYAAMFFVFGFVSPWCPASTNK
jgi:MFS family permease